MDVRASSSGVAGAGGGALMRVELCGDVRSGWSTSEWPSAWLRHCLYLCRWTERQRMGGSEEWQWPVAQCRCEDATVE